MMPPYFADTFYFVALLSSADEAHQKAMAWSERAEDQLVTTDAVLLELADALKAPRDRVGTAEYIQGLWKHSKIEVRCDDRALMQKGLDLYRGRPDKDWGLTDCISFVVMREEGIQEALTGDVHFRQAGFTTLFPD